MNKEEINQEEFGQFEPKSVSRFIVEFKPPFNIPKFVVKSTTRPTIVMKNGGHKWEEMVFSMYDPIVPSTSQSLMTGLRELRKLDDQTIEVNLTLLGPVGDKVEEWLIKGTINKVDFGTLDWETTEPLIIKLYLNVTYCVLLYS
jgi:hypothetical protein